MVGNRLALIVEDEPSMRTIYELILGPSGFEVLHAADGAEALDLLQHHSPDVVFLDMLLPKVSGEEVLQYVHEAPHLEKTAVVIVSAHKRFEQSDLLKPGDKFLLKPVQPAEIRTVAKSLVGTL